jgi:hypothetical protein
MKNTQPNISLPDPSVPISEAHAQVVGMRVIGMFNLQKNDKGRYDTDWGEKTVEGIGRSVHKILDLATK